MFKGLQQKWKVSGLRVLLILCTFALGGSLTGIAGRYIMGALGISATWLWVIVYIIIVTLVWPIAVLIVSIPFGQFRFFISYLRKMGSRMGISRSTTVDNRIAIAIFASGAGSNAARMIDHFNQHPHIRIALIVCNKPGAGVLDIASKAGIPTLIIEKERFFRGDAYVPVFREAGISFIILAGFLWKVPQALITAFSGSIINIHPALLPNYGGKGMYGRFVHEAVLAAGDPESGITIHFVDEHYDHGAVIFQARCQVLHGDTADSLAMRIHELEHRHYPEQAEKVIMNTRHHS
ncbi:phosphoribosylglycinamide formyltransferase [Nostoc ellipsosporum NOK]|nr:phosphoribosylglycinamide formyltransferase [Nostoc ellipsosporum NOK]